MTNDLYIGLMSGTSIDGIDAALVDFAQGKPSLISCHYHPYPKALRKSIMSLCENGDNEIERLGEHDVLLGQLFSGTVKSLLKKANVLPQHIRAIGSHGQTIRHHPKNKFTLQIGDPNIIAAETNITTVSDFRRKDIAHGGQGAPLVPAFHQYAFCSYDHHRAIVNIGGIANITILNKNKNEFILGFDTGPGNTLIDAWIERHQNIKYDEAGKWSASGKIHDALLKHLLDDSYFKTLPPKSTGREYFNLKWLDAMLQHHLPIPPNDVQRTLVELTARSIINAIDPAVTEIFICGGGAHNDYLMTRLQQLVQPGISVSTTESLDFHPDWIEAMAFAWLARQTLLQLPGNIPSVTGAKQAVILGGVYFNCG